MIPRRAARLALAVALGLAIVYTSGVGARDGQGQEAARRPYGFEVDGHEWVGLSPEEQMAFLRGFLGGVAAAQAAQAGGGRDGTLDRWRAELSDPELSRRLLFRFAPTVYQARLQDHYFYRDRRDQPVVIALTIINHRLLTEHF